LNGSGYLEMLYISKHYMASKPKFIESINDYKLSRCSISEWGRRWSGILTDAMMVNDTAAIFLGIYSMLTLSLRV
jgi:hypothetical protein